MRRSRNNFMQPVSSALFRVAALALLSWAAVVRGDDAVSFERLETEYAGQIRPLVKQFCLDCHSAAERDGELDLERFASLAEVRRDAKAWQKVAEMLDSSEMPPAKNPQPTADQRKQLRAWIESYLHAEALSQAGDPGPVILRRLSNAEYNYTISDLTGVESLNPTREFPVDGAAGEGFTNAGSAQAMSPSLVQKYFDAAKEVAAHAVLLPDGIAFSRYTTERDQTDELVGRIQAFYRQFTADGGGQPVNLQGIKFDTNQGGLLPLERYLATTLEERDALRLGKKTIATVANERSLSAKYLATVWQALAADRAADQGASPLLHDLRRKWPAAKSEDAPRLASDIGAMQQVLWKYSPVGHIGREGQPVTWMEPVSPVVARREFRLNLPPGSKDDVSIFLVAADAGDGHEQDYVVWENPRLTRAGSPDIKLRDLSGLQTRIDQLQREALAKTSGYLAAAAELAEGPAASEEARKAGADRHGLDLRVLDAWLAYLDVGDPGPALVEGHAQEKLANSDYEFVRGWGNSATPLILGNSSDKQVRIPGISRPHSIVAHPSPTQFIAAGWQSPLTGQVRVEARLSDAHPECGNGQEWLVEHRSRRKAVNLWQGDFGTGGSATMPPKTISVRKGELVSFILGPRDGNHSCDTTDINLTIAEVEGQQRAWDLAKDCSGDLQAANPHPDGHGNAKVWHFYQGPMTSVTRGTGEFESIPSTSLLALWQAERNSAARTKLAAQIERLATGQPPADAASPDGVLYGQLSSLVLASASLESLLADVPADERFGKHPLGHVAAAADLVVHAPVVIEFRIPAKLAVGRTFVASGHLDSEHGREGSVKLEALTDHAVELSPNPAERAKQVDNLSSTLPLSSPTVVNDGSAARERVTAALAEFRNLFPPALCYARIVPVDEVVTLTLFYRQDDQLQRLMLDEHQIAQLNRLWDELFYVAQEPLKYQVAFEQIREFATQDRPDLVKVWSPLVKTVEERTAAFRQRLAATEPAHVQAAIEFASLAWRRKLTPGEQDSLSRLYQSLREAKLPHEEAIRLTIARVLTSPAFLYRQEKPAAGDKAADVTDIELANRLSYFLWSSLPDAELRSACEAGRLTAAPSAEQELVRQTSRMLSDSRARRLAVQFACQWLHVRNFDETEEKNEKLFPEFAALRGDMYEETVRFFEDLFRNDRSILSMLDADHTFVSKSLANHYGLDVGPGNGWQRVENVRSRGRGGVLAMATVLASQSGASRTSPILRGNWIYETLLGERLPRPPAGVPQLPEQPPQGVTERTLIEAHSAVEACAKCHAKIDPYGFALEQYDAIGRLRPTPIDTKTKLVGGQEIEGLDGLRQYLLNQRRDDFVRQFCRKLLGYALGREVQLSDRPLLDKMMRDLAANQYRFSVAVEVIVLSKQFRQIRGQLTSE